MKVDATVGDAEPTITYHVELCATHRAGLAAMAVMTSLVAAPVVIELSTVGALLYHVAQ